MSEHKQTLLIDEDDIQQIKMLSESAEKSPTDGLESYEILENSIGNISTKSDDISNTIDEIEKIILQTRILSLNAAVETARAGEQGRGFSIVAREMGILAEEIKNNIKVIEEYSKDIISNVKQTAVMAEETKEKIELSEMSAQLVNQFVSGIKPK